MLYHLPKSLKLCFWVLLPLFLVSNTGIDTKFWVADNFEGSYELKATGALDELLLGTVYFETMTEYTNREVPYSNLSLHFTNNDLKQGHSLEFLISKQDTHQMISLGKYEISENIDGFLKDFDGVFGFANLNELGEKPFFTEKGKIVIAQMSDNGLGGFIDVTLATMNGETINLKGRFSAIR